MDEKRYINPNNPVYISYAWANDDFTNLEDDVNALCELLEENNIFYKRDKENLCSYRDDISKAEVEIGEGCAIIVVISERYIKSLHCMHEWHQMRSNGRIWERVFPIVLEDAKLRDKGVYRKYYEFFVERRNELVEQQNERIIPLTDVESRAAKYDYYIHDLGEMYQYLADYNSYFSKGNYAIIIEQLKKHLQGIIEKSNKPIVSPKPIEPVKIFEEPVKPTIAAQVVTPAVTPSVAHFSLPATEGLMPRDNEVENLFNLVSKKPIVNLVGVGGSGKSSLTYLLLDKHKDDFNEIAYVVVNNNLSDDIVEQLNNTLRLQFDAGEDPFLEVLSYLKESYRSKKPNILVLDINETSDKNANIDVINRLLKNKSILDGWKCLVLSREGIDTRNRISFYNLNDQEDVDFLKELFLDKAGRRYNEFGDFNELFQVVYYNPLLTEQLGFYLNKYPRLLTINGIKTMLYGDSFKEQDMHGMSAERHDETVVTFLKNLIKYNELSRNEKELLRHFVLWQTGYISYDVIEDLLRGVFESDNQLVNTLDSLSKRSILTITTNSGDTLSYKLHGLLADSLREQIDIPREDYSKYLSNIERIIEYDHYRFLPYVDCIGNSLSEYDITTDDSLSFYDLVNCVGKKFNDSWKYDYCQKVSEKNIKRIEEKRKQDDNPLFLELLVSALMVNKYGLRAISNYQKAIDILERQPQENNENLRLLANAYTVLAVLQENHLGEYRLAELNFQKVIDIFEMLSKEDPQYQNNLAGAYFNLATLQEDQFREYELAESNFKKALVIFEKLPKGNTEYQNDLASVYNSLAILQENHLGEYELAESNYKKAIEICEKLPKENTEYQFVLAGAYSNIADLQKDYLAEYESAESNYKKAIEIFEQLPKENPKYQNDLATAYNNLAALQMCYLKEYELAESNFKKAIEIREKLPKETIQYQNNLAGAYSNLANFQQYLLGDYSLSESYYKKAIEIGEQLPKVNPEYQNDLARAYICFANLQKNHLEDYASSESNYKKAIEIHEQLPDENPEYQNDLATAYNQLAYCYDAQKKYKEAVSTVEKAIDIAKALSEKESKYLIDWISYRHSLAEIVFNNNGVERAKEILTEIKPIAEKCFAEHPNDRWTQTVNNSINELLEKCANA